MRTKSGITLSALMLLPLSGVAATFQNFNIVDTASEVLYANSNDVLLGSGVVTIGYFDDTFNVSANLGDLNALLSNYTIEDTGDIGQTAAVLGVDYAGYVASLGTNVGLITGTDPRIGRPLYSFIGSGASLAISTEHALLDLGFSIGDDSPVVQTYNSNPDPSTYVGNLLIGSAGSSLGSISGSSQPTIQTALVPEPKAFALVVGVLGLGLAVLRRRGR